MFIIDLVIKKSLELKLRNQFLILVWLWIMGRHAHQECVVFMIHRYYLDQKSHHFRCSCFKWKRLSNLLHEMDRWSFYDLNQGHRKWFLIFHKKVDSQVYIQCLFKNAKTNFSKILSRERICKRTLWSYWRICWIRFICVTKQNNYAKFCWLFVTCIKMGNSSRIFLVKYIRVLVF